MISFILGSIILTQEGPKEVTVSTPSAAISEMFKRYTGAEKIWATVKMTLNLSGQTAVVDSALQIERSQKLYLRQIPHYATDKHFTCICDGKTATYEMPPAIASFPGQRAYEPQENQTLEDVYANSVPSQIDKSPVLDMIVARKQHLEFLKGQWASLAFEKGAAPQAGENYEIVGNYRPYKTSDVSGTFRLVLSPSFDVVSYRVDEKIVIPAPGNNRADTMTTIWSADVHIGTLKDPKLFEIPK